MKSIFKFILNHVPRPLLIQVSYWIKPLLGFWYRGSKFTDPINGKSYRCFLPYGYENSRENALSPETLSLERHRLMWLYLKNETDFFTKKLNVLHVAPEQCFFKKFRKQENIIYTTTDLFSPLADVKADVNNLPMKDNTYDVIFCNHVLEHIYTDLKAMSELFRVLKPNGFAILQVPMDYNRKSTYEDFSITSTEERRIHFGQYDHVRIYGWDYYERLNSVGFKTNAVNYNRKIGLENAKKYGLDLNEYLPIAIKPES